MGSTTPSAASRAMKAMTVTLYLSVPTSIRAATTTTSATNAWRRARHRRRREARSASWKTARSFPTPVPGGRIFIAVLLKRAWTRDAKTAANSWHTLVSRPSSGGVNAESLWFWGLMGLIQALSHVQGRLHEVETLEAYTLRPPGQQTYESRAPYPTTKRVNSLSLFSLTGQVKGSLACCITWLSPGPHQSRQLIFTGYLAAGAFCHCFTTLLSPR